MTDTRILALQYMRLPPGLTGKGVKVAIIDHDPDHWHHKTIRDIILTVAPNCEIYSFNTLDGTASYQAAEKSLTWCAENGVKLVNMSLRRDVDRDVLEACYAAGVVMVACAGNSGPGSDTVWWPAKSPLVIDVVGWNILTRQIETYSSQGPSVKEQGIAMPGPWTEQQGTSFYAPVTVAVLALYAELLGRYPSQAEAWEFLKAGAQDILEPGPDTRSGWGVFTWPEKLPTIAQPEEEMTKAMPTVMLDPGHGGNAANSGDPGAIGPSGLREADVNLAVARQVRELLPSAIGVKMTREDDRDVGLWERAEAANAASVDAFISVHCNYAAIAAAAGAETYALALGGEGERLARLIQGSLVAATGTANRGVKTANFAVLRQTTMPAALVEVGFISNPAEEAKLRDASYQRIVAGAIARSIAEYFGVDASPPKPVPTTDYAGHWAREAIEAVKTRGLMFGDPDGRFRPNDAVTRAELATVLARLK